MASDQWAYFQSKSIKGYLYEVQKEQLELDLLQPSVKGDPALAAEYRRRIQAYDERIKRYDKEKREIISSAKKYEETKVESQQHSQGFGMAVIFLQIAILLSSIAALMKKKAVYLLGLATGVGGVLLFVNGWFLILSF